ncbi:MAG: phosphoglycerate kinase [Saprospiraceae bacterium]|nr:phosphoglycerate kinase [Saprospiraceae bacterium]MBK7811780.1 phosphoglycerate kinase [Saprospiraceae bacterium]MBK9631786.1 phosphoglycerate kinase [Saprospiraceae bacterium]
MKDWNVKSKKVLIRVDYNVPMDENGVITDDTRIAKSIPTLQSLSSKGARIILMSHLGRPLKALLPDGSIDKTKFSLAPAAKKLSELLDQKVEFATDCGGEDSISKIEKLQDGQILLLENTRFYKQEEKADPVWAESLSKLGDFYIHDAFGTAHREHATTATIARFFDKEHKAFGDLMKAELENAEKVLNNPTKPFTAILGGAKVSDKIELISHLMDVCDHILIGGGMAYTFFAAQGYDIGKSLCEEDKKDLALSLIAQAKEKGVKLVLPLDSIAASTFSNEANTELTHDVSVPDGYMGLDIGTRTIKVFKEFILSSKTIIWNGPMGVFEMEKFSHGTEAIARAVAEATYKGCFTLVGGGDSVAAISKFELQDDVSFVSTGGGAMLELLEGKELPGVEAIRS